MRGSRKIHPCSGSKSPFNPESRPVGPMMASFTGWSFEEGEPVHQECGELCRIIAVSRRTARERMKK